MGRDTVHVSRAVQRPAKDVWAVVRQFCVPWHPLIATMQAEQGGFVRAFTVKGAATQYRERLTWFSDSDQCLRYTHVSGIEGADRYDATVMVADDGAGARVTWSAEVAGPRSAEIANGSEAIFEAGIAALTDAVPVCEEVAVVPAAVEIAHHHVDGAPQLAMSATPTRAGPICVFLHGIGGNRSNWDAQLKALGPYVQCVSLDLRGYGDSALGADQSQIEDYCADILRVRAEFGADQIILCGLSYGAWIATSFAMRHPEILAGLVLAGGCTGMSEASEQERADFLNARASPLAQGQTPADFAPRVVDIIAGPHAGTDIRAQLLNSMAEIPSQTYKDALVCFTTPKEHFDFNRITCPVLMMTGQFDRLAPPDEIRSVAQRIHDAGCATIVRFEDIPGAGHVCNLEAPDAVNRLILDVFGADFFCKQRLMRPSR